MSETTLGALVSSGVLSLGDGYRTRQSELAESGYRIIRVADVRDGRISMESPDFVDAVYERQIGTKAAHAGDVLLTTKGTVGRVAVVPDSIARAVYSPQLCWFRVADFGQLNPRFLSYWLQSPAFLAQSSYLQGNTDMAPYISLSDLRASKITLPRIGEQQAIAEVLGAFDDKIAANITLAGRVDDYLTGRFEELTEDSRRIALGDVADVNRESIKPRKSGPLRYVDIASVSVGSFEFPEITDWADAPGRARRALRAGDTIWSTVRPNRRSHALNLEDDPLLVASTGLAVLSPRSVGFAFLYEAAKRTEFSSYLENVAEGSAYPAVLADRFLRAPVPDVSPKRMDDFEREAAPLRASVSSRERENRTLAAVRDALLPQLMSGKLRVRDAEAAATAAGA